MQLAKRNGPLYSTMFSPADPTVFAICGYSMPFDDSLDEGAALYDTRNLNRY